MESLCLSKDVELFRIDQLLFVAGKMSLIYSWPIYLSSNLDFERKIALPKTYFDIISLKNCIKNFSLNSLDLDFFNFNF